jgi:predicted nucleic acid-binding protein
MNGHRQVTDAHLVALARRRETRVVTFDAGLLTLGGANDVELLSSL